MPARSYTASDFAENTAERLADICQIDPARLERVRFTYTGHPSHWLRIYCHAGSVKVERRITNRPHTAASIKRKVMHVLGNAERAAGIYRERIEAAKAESDAELKRMAALVEAVGELPHGCHIRKLTRGEIAITCTAQSVEEAQALGSALRTITARRILTIPRPKK